MIERSEMMKGRMYECLLVLIDRAVEILGELMPLHGV